MFRFSLVLMAFVLLTTPAWASGGGGDPMAPVLLGLAVVIPAALLGAHLAKRLGQPPVLGELLAGVALGAVLTGGPSWLSGLSHDPALDAIAGMGVCLLLFDVGLESTVGEMTQVGIPALAVACLGVIAPFGLGWAVSAWLLPHQSSLVHAFLGAALTATSVGITARVLQDARSGQSAEARIILGAAVIDDVLGLLILALVSGAVQASDAGTLFSATGILPILGKAVLFIGGFIVLGQRLSALLFSWSARLEGPRVHLVVALAFCFLGSLLACGAGLAPIVGAYAAGLVLEPQHLARFRERGAPELTELLHSLTAFLVPVFFVQMGMRVDVAALLAPEALALGAGLAIAAVLGKLACAIAVPAGVDPLTVALGMVPRGEVGLIFANTGLTLLLGGRALLDEKALSALVMMVIVTTLLAPPLLKWAIGRSRERNRVLAPCDAPELV